MDINLLIKSLMLLPLVASPIVYLLGRTSVRKGTFLGMSFAKMFTILVILVEGYLTFLTAQLWLGTSSSIYTNIGTVLIGFDGVSCLMCLIVVILGFCVTLFSFPYMQNEDGEEKFYALLLALIGSIVGLGISQDLFNLWVWFEVMAISTYFLVAFYHEQPASLEAGFKYLTQSAVGSALALFGIAILFSKTGTVYLPSFLGAFTALDPLLYIGGILIIVGFGVKAALVPLHTWLPDAHSQAPSGISAMLSGIVIEAGLVAMLRVLVVLNEVTHIWGAILLALGCVNILIGNLMALRQTEVKRLLAYSSIAQVGYMLVGFGVTLYIGFTTGVMGAAGGYFHMFTHALMKGLAFLAAGALLYVLHLAKGNHSPLVLDDLNGASKKYPAVALMFSVALLGLGGLPPMAGFMSKWQILVSAAQGRSGWLIAVVIFVGLNSILSLAYYAPIVNRMYRHEQSEVVTAGEAVSSWMITPMVILTIGILLLGVWPSLISKITIPAANIFLSPFGF
jgi:proton-translocating NADH-quinone oxidoreductase chain N